MSPRLISRSPDLLRLVSQGYQIEVRGPLLFVYHCPYVTAACAVAYGTLLMALTLAGDVTTAPDDHTARFIGEKPHDADGRPLNKMINGGAGQLNGVRFDFSFSAKPKPEARYRDYNHKVNAYIARLTGPAQQIEPRASALTFVPLVEDGDGSPFLYTDTATPRAGLEQYADRLGKHRVAIVGVGGTGSYILDLVCKTTVAEVHLFDGDRILQHNPFRSPGPVAAREIRGAPNKAEFWARRYTRRFRRDVIGHPYLITADNVAELGAFDFVFIAIDDGPSRDMITRALEDHNVPFVDVGLGVNDIDNQLSSTVRVSTGTPTHPVDRSRLPTHPPLAANDYRHNIQIAELNALNAALAVIKWKKIVGIYADLEHEHFSTYSTSVNAIVNADHE